MQYTINKILAIKIFIIILVASIAGYIITLQFNDFFQNTHNQSTPYLEVEIGCDTTSGDSPLEIQFSAITNKDTLPSTSYQWDFGDGFSSTGKNPTHIFRHTGIYYTKVTITDEQGFQKTDSIVITVEEPEPLQADITASTLTGISPLLVHFYGNNEDNNDNLSYSWEFGPKYRFIVPESKYRHSLIRPYILYHYRNREFTSNKRDPTMVFLQSGAYWVTLTVTDEHGNKASETIWIHAYRIETDPD